MLPMIWSSASCAVSVGFAGALIWVLIDRTAGHEGRKKREPCGSQGTNSCLYFDQHFTRVDPVALGHVHRLDGTGDGRLDLGFHLHRLADQQRLAGLDGIAFLDQHVDDIARHAGADVARRTGLLALAAAGATDEIVQRLGRRLFGHSVEWTGALACLRWPPLAPPMKLFSGSNTTSSGIPSMERKKWRLLSPFTPTPVMSMR